MIESEYQRGRASIQPDGRPDANIRDLLDAFLDCASRAKAAGDVAGHSFHRGSYDALIAWTSAHRPWVLAADAEES